MKLTFQLLDELYAVVRLDPQLEIPGWLPSGGFLSITRTEEELSIVCLEDSVPSAARAERGWRVFKLLGPIPFETTGVAAAFTAPLAAARISVFVLSTYDTDYLLVKQTSLNQTIEALQTLG